MTKILTTVLIAAFALTAQVAIAANEGIEFPPITREDSDFVMVKRYQGERLEIVYKSNARPWPKDLRIAIDAKIEGLMPGETFRNVLPARIEVRGLRMLAGGAAEITDLRIETRYSYLDIQD